MMVDTVAKLLSILSLSYTFVYRSSSRIQEYNIEANPIHTRCLSLLYVFYFYFWTRNQFPSVRVPNHIFAQFTFSSLALLLLPYSVCFISALVMLVLPYKFYITQVSRLLSAQFCCSHFTVPLRRDRQRVVLRML